MATAGGARGAPGGSRLWGSVIGRPLAQRLVADVLRPAPGARCLDLPCGVGVLSAALAAAVGARGHVIAADPDAGARRACREEVDGRGLTTVDVAGWPQQETLSVDVAGSLLTLPHRHTPAALLAVAAAALRPGGVLAAGVWGEAAAPVAEVAAALAEVLGGRLVELDTALAPGRRDSLGRLAAAAGLGGAEVLRLRDVVRFNGPDHLLAAVTGLGEVEAVVESLDDAQLALVLAALRRRLAGVAAADGTLVMPVELAVLRWVRP